MDEQRKTRVTATLVEEKLNMLIEALCSDMIEREGEGSQSLLLKALVELRKRECKNGV